MDNVKDFALDMLHKSQKSLDVAMEYAKKRNAKDDEIENLRKKIMAVNWLIRTVKKED